MCSRHFGGYTSSVALRQLLLKEKPKLLCVHAQKVLITLPHATYKAVCDRISLPQKANILLLRVYHSTKSNACPMTGQANFIYNKDEEKLRPLIFPRPAPATKKSCRSSPWGIVLLDLVFIILWLLREQPNT